MSVKAIVCVDKNWGIGYKGDLLFRIPDDMKFFREKTLNNIVIMGRKTYENIGKPLPDRENIVLSHKVLIKKQIHTNTILASSAFVSGYMEAYKKCNPEKIFYIIGGESIYRMYLSMCDEIYVTMVDKETEADRYFINLDKSDDFVLDEVLKAGYILDGSSYKITKWVRKSV